MTFSVPSGDYLHYQRRHQSPQMITYIIKEDINALWCSLVQLLDNITGLIVEDIIKPQVPQPLTFGFCSSTTNNFATL